MVDFWGGNGYKIDSLSNNRQEVIMGERPGEIELMDKHDIPCTGCDSSCDLDCDLPSRPVSRDRKVVIVEGGLSEKKETKH